MENDLDQTQETQNSGNYYNNQPLNSLPNATAVLVLGIVSIPTCFCYGVVGLACGIIALVLAKGDLLRLNAEPEKYSEGSAKNLRAGKICAIVGVSLSALYVLFVLIAIIFFGRTNPQAIFNHYNSI